MIVLVIKWVNMNTYIIMAIDSCPSLDDLKAIAAYNNRI